MIANINTRSQITRAHPAVDALEERIQSNVIVSSSRSRIHGKIFMVEANCTGIIGVGKTIPLAVENFTRNFGL